MDILHEKIQNGTRSEIRRQVQFDYNVTEANSLIRFNDRSICSILKSEGGKVFDRYENLDNPNNALYTYCLSGILDLASESQRELYTNDQWSFIKKSLKSPKSKHFLHLTKAMKTC
ncbi:hypothetical protein HPULCUR_006777 [Helicostylum pulchrum]|uniref:Uncharacterized protein n=1 Tax=Helicostylum pulchrum TaxID=562976 RepID=A0ABP9Y2U9_9FUNG